MDLKESHLQDQPHACRESVFTLTQFLVPFLAVDYVQMLCEKDFWEE